MKKSKLLIFLGLYLISIGVYFFINTVSVCSMRKPFSALINKSAQETMDSAMAVREDVPEDSIAVYDAKLSQLRGDLGDVKELYFGKSSGLMVFAGIVGGLVSMLYVLCGIRLLYCSIKSLPFLNFANMGFVLFYVVLCFEIIVNVLPVFDRLFETINDLIKIGDPHSELASTGGPGGGFLVIMGGAFFIIYSIFYIVIPRWLISVKNIKSRLQ